MMEDLLLAREKDNSKDSNSQQSEIVFDNSNKAKSDFNKKENINDENNSQVETIKKLPEKLLVNYNKWHYFLLTWKRLEMIKLEWVRKKLGLEQINTPEIYARYW